MMTFNELEMITHRKGSILVHVLRCSDLIDFTRREIAAVKIFSTIEFSLDDYPQFK